MRRTILWREADTHPEVARCMHAFHDELVDLATEVIGLADPAGSDPAARHPAALAWTGTMTLALNTARLGRHRARSADGGRPARRRPASLPAVTRGAAFGQTFGMTVMMWQTEFHGSRRT